ncbi:hypothetical protein LOD99_11550 [Oopsacas minuta]|uniref:BZIP domain-containing protein n=1 Tax=Oopsacas minuta TaxID=111878 RepID=A0AAV7JL43_9METZ|nr:hypothetical protein LOD99_11550 [Oopsacas minuta]
MSTTIDSHKIAKCQRTKQILSDDWEMKMEDTDFKDLIDTEKLKSLGKIDYRNLSKLGLLSDTDKAFISENRRKVNNRRAAKRFRESEKSRHLKLNSTLTTLSEEKNALKRERQLLISEIQMYNQLIQAEHQRYFQYY